MSLKTFQTGSHILESGSDGIIEIFKILICDIFKKLRFSKPSKIVTLEFLIECDFRDFSKIAIFEIFKKL